MLPVALTIWRKYRRAQANDLVAVEDQPNLGICVGVLYTFPSGLNELLQLIP